MNSDSPPTTSQLHILGLQRSGTNYLASLLKDNLHVNVLPSGDRSICWKHALPSEPTPQQCSAAEGVIRHSKVFIALVAKHPLHWVASITLRNPQDLFLKRKALLNDGLPSLSHVCALYENFYRSWLDILDGRGRYCLVRYEELLAAPATGIRNFATALGMRPPPSMVSINAVPYSGRRDQDNLAYYLNGEHGLEDDAAVSVTANIDTNLLHRMGYSDSPPLLYQATKPACEQ
jgi:hypothetical protein